MDGDSSMPSMEEMERIRNSYNSSSCCSTCANRSSCMVNSSSFVQTCFNYSPKPDFSKLIAMIIDDAVKEKDDLLKEKDDLLRNYQRTLNEAYEALKNATKIIKAQPDIVRCKDCSHGSMDPVSYPRVWCKLNIKYKKADGFCDEGERRSDGN